MTLLVALGVVVLEPEVATEVRRFAPAGGSAGGPMDVLTPIEGRGFTPTPEGRVFEGVPVREVAVLDGAVTSCFVGDFVGD